MVRAPAIAGALFYLQMLERLQYLNANRHFERPLVEKSLPEIPAMGEMSRRRSDALLT